MPRANNRTRLLSAFLLLVMLFGFAGVSPAAAAEGTWTATGSLDGARHDHTATLLPNGKVLVAGGRGDSGVPASGQIYHPATGTWTATGSLIGGRGGHTATLLPNGNVLVAGGFDDSGGALASARGLRPGGRHLDRHRLADRRSRSTTPPRCFRMAKCWSQGVFPSAT